MGKMIVAFLRPAIHGKISTLFLPQAVPNAACFLGVIRSTKIAVLTSDSLCKPSVYIFVDHIVKTNLLFLQLLQSRSENASGT